MKDKGKPTNYKDKTGATIHVGDRLVMSPSWSIEDIYCKVIDENTVKWEKPTTLRKELDYWANYFYIVA